MCFLYFKNCERHSSNNLPSIGDEKSQSRDSSRRSSNDQIRSIIAREEKCMMKKRARGALQGDERKLKQGFEGHMGE